VRKRLGRPAKRKESGRDISRMAREVSPRLDGREAEGPPTVGLPHGKSESLCTSRPAHRRNRRTATDFLKALIEAVPYEAKLRQAVNAAFATPDSMTAAFLVTRCNVS
jgi:hypothetical protein